MSLIKHSKRERGVTLVELLVALVLNIILFTAIISVFYKNLTHYNQTLKMNRLNQQLQDAIELMASEIRRAGYWASANSLIGTSSNTNPFMSTANGTDLTVSSTCILFTYDKANNGSIPTISTTYDDERYGFRLSGQALQARPPGAAFACNAAANAWENMTDVNIVLITNLQFTLNTTTTASGAISLLQRSVDITMTGRLANDATITKTVTQHVEIANDKFTP